MKTRIFTLFVLFFASFSLSAATRVAIVLDSKAPLSDMLTAELSVNPDIELLDRAEIAKVLSEQKIAASILDEKGAFSLGKLISTDLFIVLQNDFEKKTPIGIIVFDAHSGLRYWDSALPEEKEGLPSCAKFAAATVKQALDKRQKSLEGKLNYISLLSVRNADLPREKDYLCNAIGTLLMRRLGNSPDIAVIERSHLDWLNKERSLPGMEWSNKLLSANILLKLQIEMQSPNEISCKLSDSTHQFVDARASIGDPVLLTKQLAERFAASCSVSERITELNPEKEAVRFHQEAMTLHSHKKYSDALEKIEVAFALSPGNQLYQTTVSKYMDDKVLQMLNPNYSGQNVNYNIRRKIAVSDSLFADVLSYTSRSLDHKLSLVSNIDDDKDSRIRQKRISEILGWSRILALFQDLSAVDVQDNTENQRLLSECKSKAMECFMLRYDSQMALVKDKKSYEAYRVFCSGQFGAIKYIANDAETAFRTLAKLSQDWLTLSARYAEARTPEEAALCPSSIIKFAKEICLYANFPINDSDPTPVANLFSKMKESKNSDMQLYGEYGLLCVENMKTATHQDQKVKRLLDFQDRAIERIKSLPADTPPLQLANCYLLTLDACSDLPNDIRRKRKRYLFEFMEAEHVFLQNIALSAIVDAVALSDPLGGLDMIDASRNLLSSPTTKILQFERKNFEDNMQRLNDAINERRPDLMAETYTKKPWKSQKLVFSSESRKNIVGISCPIIYNNALYLAAECEAQGENSSYIEALKIFPSSGEIRSMGKASIPRRLSECMKSGQIFRRNSIINDSCISSGGYVIGTVQDGIFIFNESAEVHSLNEGNGLPSNCIQSFTIFDDIIYAGLGEKGKTSYFASINLSNGGTCKVIASSLRDSRQTPFDNVSPVEYPWIGSSKKTNKVILFASLWRSPLNGLWSFDPSDGKFEMLLRVDSSCEWATMPDEQNLIVADTFISFRYDIEKNKAVLLQNNYTSLPHNDSIELHPLSVNSFRDFGPNIFINGWRWTADPFGRISPDNKTQEKFYFHDGKKILQPTEFMETLSLNGSLHLVAADSKSIWLFELDEGK